jgi:uncharacterized membrane protein
MTDSLAVWRFAGLDGADAVLDRLVRLARDGALGVDDAAHVSWPPGHRKPTMHELGDFAGPGRLWKGFWGVLLALIFLAPIAGPTFGAAAGAFAGTLADFGVQDDVVKRVRDTVVPGTSALFVIGDSSAIDRVTVALGDFDVVMLRSDLSHEQTVHLRDALGDESVLR